MKKKWSSSHVQSNFVDTQDMRILDEIGLHQEVIWIPTLFFVVGTSLVILVLCIDILFFRAEQLIVGCERKFASVVEIEDLCLVMSLRLGDLFLQ